MTRSSPVRDRVPPRGWSRRSAVLGIAALTATMLPAGLVQAGPTTDDLVFTEYIEGSSFNKALEIYNGTGAPVDLSAYTLHLFTNGAASPSQSLALSGSLPDGDVFVAAHPNANAAILAEADVTSSAVINFNGDDALTLTSGGGTVTDSIGQVGFDPGSAWSSGGVTTQNATMRRADLTRDTDPSDVFDPSERWTGHAQDDSSDLGSFGGTTSDPCEVTATIPEVQGSGDASPLEGQVRTVEGVVTDAFSGGFWMQDPVGDGDPATSDGLFVFTGNASASIPFLDAGDVVEVCAPVVEFRGLTELTSVQAFERTGTGATVTPLAFAFPAMRDLESYEGMLLDLDQTLYVTDLFDLRFGELAVSGVRPLVQPTEVFEPGSPEAAALATTNARNLVELAVDFDLLADTQAMASGPVRRGDTIDLDTLAIITEVFNDKQLFTLDQPFRTADEFDLDGPRPPAPSVGGDVQVASFNVLNYFNGPDFPTPRGAETPEEFAEQRTKILAAIQALDADVVGLMEIENDGYGPDSAIADLVDGLNALGSRNNDWRYVAPSGGPLGSDAIAVGLIYRSKVVQHVGHAAVLDNSVDPRFDDDKNRPVLAATFNHEGTKFTVAVNHLKSKGSPCDDVGDPNTGDGSGNCNLTRTRAAEAEADWLAGNPTGFRTAGTLVVGDLNAYSREDPVDAFRDAGYTSLIPSTFADPSYTFVFFGAEGMLDHALADDALVDRVTGAAIWHLNADEAPLLEYDGDESLYQPGPYRSSDHDAILVGLDL